MCLGETCFTLPQILLGSGVALIILTVIFWLIARNQDNGIITDPASATATSSTPIEKIKSLFTEEEEDTTKENVEKVYLLASNKVEMVISWSDVQYETVKVTNNTTQPVLVHFYNQDSDDNTLPMYLVLPNLGSVTMTVQELSSSFTVEVYLDSSKNPDSDEADESLDIERP